MKRTNLSLVVSAVIFSMSASSWALVPWSIVPITATTLTVPSNATANVEYKVTNHSAKQHTLVMIPIAGISQTSSGTRGISTNAFTLPTGGGICTNIFTLPSGASCSLLLQVNANALTTNIIGGPQICQADVNGQPDPQECYQPASPAETLNITTSGALAVGDSFGGGTVACLGGAPYLNLIAATSDGPNSPKQWGGEGILVPNASYSNDGATNTSAIVNCLTNAVGQGCAGSAIDITTFAAGNSKIYGGGGYHDWFLPANSQLDCLYNNRSQLLNINNAGYWSSTQDDSTGAYYQIFYSPGTTNVVTKSNTTTTFRCVRALTL